MTKTTKRKSIHSIRSSTKKRKSIRRSIRSIRSNPSNTCCMCEKRKTGIFYLPMECSIKHGSRSHKMCEKCWVDKFAFPYANHRCPGCVKGMPLTKSKKLYVPKDVETIDLTLSP
jgi:hypothetical protein